MYSLFLHLITEKQSWASKDHPKLKVESKFIMAAQSRQKSRSS